MRETLEEALMGMYRLPRPPRPKTRSKRRDLVLEMGEEVLDVESLLPLYHGTSSDRIPQIQKMGLCTPKSCKAKQVWGDMRLFRECRRSGVYLTPEPENAEDYAEVAVDASPWVDESGQKRRRKVAEGAEPVVFVIEHWNKKCRLFEDPEVDDYSPAAYIMYGCDCIKPTRHYFPRKVYGRKTEVYA